MKYEERGRTVRMKKKVPFSLLLIMQGLKAADDPSITQQSTRWAVNKQPTRSPVTLLSWVEEQVGGSVSPVGGIVLAEDRQKTNIDRKVMSRRNNAAKLRDVNDMLLLSEHLLATCFMLVSNLAYF
jgi:hypothetical protein